MLTRRGFAARLAAAVAGFAALIAVGLPQARAEGTVTVFAAASLKDALDSVNAAWKAESGKEATISYAASSAAAKQIEGGAPADVFISADLDWMKYLSDKNLTKKDTELKLLGNQIVLVAPKDSTATTTIAPNFDLAGLIGEGKLAMADVKAVPAGKYGKAALEKLGVWGSVDSKVAQAENVRAALKLVSTGEAALGIVYATDAVAEPGVKVIGTFPEDSHRPIVYPVAELAASKSADAGGFIKFLQSPKAQELFKAQGFTYLAATN
jgi:molybdate transport system substrate-binding protein